MGKLFSFDKGIRLENFSFINIMQVIENYIFVNYNLRIKNKNLLKQNKKKILFVILFYDSFFPCSIHIFKKPYNYYWFLLSK